MDAYADFIDEVSAGGFDAPVDAGWTAEQIAANVVHSHEDLIAVTEAVLAGERVAYDDRERTDVAELDRCVAAYDSLVPVRIIEDDEVIVDQPLPWGKLLELDEEVYVPRRLAQLRALRPS